MILPLFEGTRSPRLMSALYEAFRIWSIDNGSLYPAVLSVRVRAR